MKTKDNTQTKPCAEPAVPERNNNREAPAESSQDNRNKEPLTDEEILLMGLFDGWFE